jgi:hypothetical protein
MAHQATYSNVQRRGGYALAEGWRFDPAPTTTSTSVNAAVDHLGHALLLTDLLTLAFDSNGRVSWARSQPEPLIQPIQRTMATCRAHNRNSSSPVPESRVWTAANGDHYTVIRPKTGMERRVGAPGLMGLNGAVQLEDCNNSSCDSEDVFDVVGN